MSPDGRTIDPRSVRVARGELRRTLRSIRETPREAIGVAISAVVLVPFTIGGAAGAFFLGRAIRTGSGLADAVFPGARAVVGLVWLSLVALAGFRTVAKVGDLEVPALSLTAVPVRTLVAGRLLAEGVAVGAWLALPLSIVGAAFVVGARAPLALAGLSIAAAFLWLSAIALGFVLGICATYVSTRFEPIARYRTALGLLATFAYLGIFVTGAVDGVFDALYGPLQHWPIGWLADVVFLGVRGVDASARAATAGVLAAVVVTLGALGLAPRAAARYWLADPPSDRSRSPAETGRGVVDRALAPIAGRRTRAVAIVAWRRTRRAPVRLVFLLYPLFAMIEPARRTLESLQTTGTAPAWVPPLVFVYVVWASGMVFTLNPLGDQGATLQTTLAVPDAGRPIVRGRILIGALATLPPALALVGVAAVASALSPIATAGLLASTAVATVAAIAFAAGIGVRFPRFGAVSVTRNREAVVPSKAAAAIYSLLVIALVASVALVAYEPVWGPIAAVVSALLSSIGRFDAEVTAVAVRLVGAIALVPLAIVPAVSYRYAVGRISAYTLE